MIHRNGKYQLNRSSHAGISSIGASRPEKNSITRK